MAYSHLGVANQEVVELDDIFESGKKVQISVKKGLSFSENAQLYYVKSKNTRKSIVANKDRMVDIQRKLQVIDGMITSFQNVDGTRTLDRWLKDNDDSLRQMIPLSSTGQVAARPWHTLWAEGYEVWIGKSATGNDELTQAAHKEDIWMHARHVPGSHVVIRMSRRTDFPPKNVLEMVAAWAAWHSKAKSAGMVPVAATKRKHVRKPKGAAPGSVLVDKEQVFLVEPVKPANDQVL
jgi:predicted ribosome quality control (RQC) complex YloA/Tae2 family protein